MDATQHDVPRTERHARAPRRRRARWVGWGLLVLVVLALVAAGLLVRDALTARDALARAMDEVPAAEEALRAGDLEAADATLARVQPLTATARASTDGLLWSLAAHLPLVGQDVRAFSASAATVDDLAATVLPSLAQVLAVVDGDAVAMTAGAVDLAPLEQAVPLTARAADAFDAIDARHAAVDRGALHAEIAEPYDRLTAATDELRPLVRTAERVTALGPAMLGADGPRRYLVLALNNAELRATGGIPGALAVVTVDGGRVTLERQAATADVPPFDAPVLPLDPGAEQLYSDRLGRFVQDTTLTPDFPTTASLAAAMWEQAQGQAVDGVVATDPVALSYLLEATGPLDVGGRTVDAGNVVQVLLADAYAQLEAGEETDAFFASVAATVLGTVLAGGADPGTATDALDRAAAEHRLLLWSARADEQERLAGTVVAGDLDTAERAAGTVGVFLNDGTGGKMGWFLDSAVELASSTCTADGRVDTFAVTLASTAPADAATSLPWYVTGGGVAGVEPGVTRTFVALYPPRGGRVTDARLDDAPVSGQPATVAGRAALSVAVDLAPGQGATLTFAAVDAGAPPGGTPADGGTDGSGGGAPPGRLDVWSTPTARAPGLRTVDVATCG
ncbi:DUF4012 domain-containing protein [Cellulosimicrobium sp. CUA-896]|uniref:DUF4012 domain-containing protein n=1 Tax=Cellulosimicrobium sp. CUA-896 TaxID=1517881 RepID=UPI00095E023C|nr:DUF4012 domain-containing protein [Cellulosimicrobium sp. CUA-896]OLT52260.1 hypothetical protein BJF88_14330 [Cellulosimicrobium sp. CUA-896]